jgi:GntR family transcriptional regulator/MocR family aminotransferase
VDHSGAILQNSGVVQPLFELEIKRPPRGSRDACRLLHAQLRAAILEGRLPPGALLPSTRQSSAVFGVSRNTAIELYERLLNDGLVVAQRGSGTRVVEVLPRKSVSSLGSAKVADGRLNPFWRSAEVRTAIGFWRSELEDSQVAAGSSASLEFRPALVDGRLFPQAALRRCVTQQMRSVERKPPRFRSPQGNPGNHGLRAAITQHTGITRAIACQPSDVLITAGAQQAFDVLARALVAHTGMTVAVEDPGYPPMRVAFAAAGARLVPIPVDADGLIVERIPGDAKVICLSPSHHFPLGMSLSAERRKALIAYARLHGAVIVEDDYDGEFRHANDPLGALISDNAADVVFYVGTFSKCMTPALRLGFVIAPPWAMDTLVAVKNSSDWHCPSALQAGVAAFITDGELSRHLRKMRRVYHTRRETLLTGLTGLGRWLEVIPSRYGMHVSAVSRDGREVDAIAERLLRENIRLHTFARYFLGPPDRHGFVFGLGVADHEDIRRGLERVQRELELRGKGSRAGR